MDYLVGRSALSEEGQDHWACADRKMPWRLAVGGVTRFRREKEVRPLNAFGGRTGSRDVSRDVCLRSTLKGLTKPSPERPMRHPAALVAILAGGH